MKLLIVDDVETNRYILQLYVEQLGLAYDTAENGQEAVEKVKADNYTLIFMDINMPVMDGATAAKVIRHELNLSKTILPIIATTGSLAHKLLTEDDFMLFNSILTKPFNLSDIKGIIDNLTDKNHQK